MSEVGSAPYEPWREPVRGGHPDPELTRLSGFDQLQRTLTVGATQAPLSRLTGLRLEELGEGTASFRMPLTGWLRGADGTVAPGPLTIPADAAMACAIMSQLPPWTPFTTSELALRLLRPAPSEGSVRAEAHVIGSAPGVALAEASLRDDSGQLLAHGTSLCVTLPPVRGQAAPSRPQPSDGEHGPDPWQRTPPPAASRPRGLDGLETELHGETPPPPLHRFTGLTVSAVGAGEVSFSLPASPWFCAPPAGRVQGGVVALLADAALSGAVESATPETISYAPMEIKLNFLRPLRSDGRPAQAHARRVHSGRQIAVATAELVDADGRAIAVASGSGRLGSP